MEKYIISRFKEGDAEAFERIYRAYWPKVYSFVSLYIRSATEVEDMVQELFIHLWEIREKIDEEQSFEGFLFISARNLIFARQRSSFNEVFFDLTVLESTASAVDVEGELSAADLSEQIDHLVSQLTPRQQEVYRLSRQELLTYAEIAKRLNISERTVEKHLSEVLHYLRQHLICKKDASPTAKHTTPPPSLMWLLFLLS